MSNKLVAPTSRDGNTITAFLERAAEECNLVAPATAVGFLPEGCGIAFSTVLVSTDKRSGDVYETQGGKCALGRAALDKLAACSGVTWDPMRSGRLDDGKDPRYCRFRVVGHYRAFDGTIQTVVGEKEMDLRDNSPQCLALAARKRDGSGDAEKQIREMRLHIQAHAESKARLRAIRSLGIKGAYTQEELAKPFMVAKVVFTGQTSDPKLRREFARMQAQQMIQGMSALFGAAPALPAPSAEQLHAASAIDDDDDYIDAPGETVPTPPPPPPVPREARQAAPERKSEPKATDGFVLPLGKSKGLKPSEAPIEDLEWIESYLGAALNDPNKAQYKDRNQTVLAHVVKEIERRHGVVNDEIDRGNNPDNY